MSDHPSGYLDDRPTAQTSELLASLQAQGFARSAADSAGSPNEGRSYATARRPPRRDPLDLNLELQEEDDVSDRLSESGSDDSYDSEEEARLIQQEWDEGVRQLQLILRVMLIPYIGKFFGRKWSYWAYARYSKHGLSTTFFGLSWLWPTSSSDLASSAVAVLQPTA